MVNVRPALVRYTLYQIHIVCAPNVFRSFNLSVSPSRSLLLALVNFSNFWPFHSTKRLIHILCIFDIENNDMGIKRLDLVSDSDTHTHMHNNIELARVEIHLINILSRP